MTSSSKGFGSSLRVKKRSRFLYLQEHGDKFHSRNFLIVLQRTDNAESRLGMVVSRKIDKRAVVRNRIKRRIKEIFRIFRSRFEGSWDLIVIARRGAVDCRFAEVRKQILGTLKRAGVLKPPQSSKRSLSVRGSNATPKAS